MIEYAGQKLLLDDGTVQRLVEHYGTLDDLYCAMDPAAMHYGHQAPPVAWWRVAAASAPAHVRRARPPRWLINSLWMPTGASRVGIGLFLIETERLATVIGGLDSKGGATLKLSHTLNHGTQTNTVTRSGTMYLLPPIGLMGECRSLWVLPLVDGRWFWQFRIIEASKDKTPSTFDWDAAEACVDAALAGLPGITWGARDDWERPDWFAMGSRAANAGTYIDALCASTGRRLIYSWEDGQGYADNAATAMTEHIDRVTDAEFGSVVLHGGDTFPEDVADGYGTSTRPSTINVIFDRRQGGYHEQRGFVWKETVACETLVDDGVQAGELGDWEMDFHTTAQADFSSRGGTPDNDADINALAVRIATSYLEWTKLNWDYFVAGVGIAGTDVCAADDYWWFILDRAVRGAPAAFATDAIEDPLADMDDEPTFFTRWKSMSPTDAYWQEQCQQFAGVPLSRMATGLCRVQLTSKLVRGQSATANVFHFDQDGGTYAVDADYEVTVFDPLERFSGEIGERFWACALPHDSARFEIVSPSNDGVLLAYATLDENLCASNDGVTAVRDFRRFPDCQPMDVTHVWNPHKHAGPKDGRVIVVRRDCPNNSGSGGSGSGGSGAGAERWEVMDVVLRTACAVMQVEDRGQCLTSAHHRFRGEWSPEDDPHEVCIITPINPCPPNDSSGASGSGGSGSSGGGCDLSWTFENFVCCGVFIDCSPGSGSGGSGSGGGA